MMSRNLQEILVPIECYPFEITSGVYEALSEGLLEALLALGTLGIISISVQVCWK